MGDDLAVVVDSERGQQKPLTVEELARIHRSNRPEKPRSPQEIRARYDLDRKEYQQLMSQKQDNREQRLMLYAEIKVLGWCMGREESKVIKEINTPVR